MTEIRNSLALAAVRLNALIREAHANGLVVHVHENLAWTPDSPEPMPQLVIWTEPSALVVALTAGRSAT